MKLPGWKEKRPVQLFVTLTDKTIGLLLGIIPIAAVLIIWERYNQEVSHQFSNAAQRVLLKFEVLREPTNPMSAQLQLLFAAVFLAIVAMSMLLVMARKI